jgi:hypothetical protein
MEKYNLTYQEGKKGFIVRGKGDKRVKGEGVHGKKYRVI